MHVVNSGKDWLVFCGCGVIILECYVILVDWFNARFFFKGQISFGGTKKSGLFCDVEKADWLSEVLEACDEALLVDIIADGLLFPDVTSMQWKVKVVCGSWFAVHRLSYVMHVALGAHLIHALWMLAAEGELSEEYSTKIFLKYFIVFFERTFYWVWMDQNSPIS